MKNTLLVALACLAFPSFSTGQSGDLEHPPHLKLARSLLSSLDPERNSYGARPTRIVWPDEAGAHGLTENQSVCSSFCTALLRKSYSLSKEQLIDLFQEEWPEADEMFQGVTTKSAFEEFTSIREAKPGDFIVVDYKSEKKIPTGHIMLISEIPKEVKNYSPKKLPYQFSEPSAKREITQSEVVEWHIRIIDSSKSGHGKWDTREPTNDSGLGEGTLRFLTDSHGTPIGYSWSNLKVSKVWLTQDRPIALARWKGIEKKSGG